MLDPLSTVALAGLDAIQAECVAREAYGSNEKTRDEFGFIEVATAYARAAARGLVHIRDGEPKLT